jgi:hypothetical protein
LGRAPHGALDTLFCYWQTRQPREFGNGGVLGRTPALRMAMSGRFAVILNDITSVKKISMRLVFESTADSKNQRQIGSTD